MTKGSSMTDEELNRLGVTRKTDEFGRAVYLVPCVVCGKLVGMHMFTTQKVVKCSFCKKEIVKRRKAKVDAAREEILSILAEDLGTDYEHLRRFEKATTKFGRAYADNIEDARTAIDKFDSIPEAVACIELLHIGTRVIVHQRVGDYTVDFCLPEEKVVVEIDGSLYHNDEAKEQMRDYAISHMLEGDWEIRHIPADAVMKNHVVFGKGMRRMLNERREELGIERLS